MAPQRRDLRAVVVVACAAAARVCFVAGWHASPGLPGVAKKGGLLPRAGRRWGPPPVHECARRATVSEEPPLAAAAAAQVVAPAEAASSASKEEEDHRSGSSSTSPQETISSIDAYVSARDEGEKLRASGARRMRFAPSPTGSLHVGGARTALYNWLAAKQTQDGQFVIRIEDTDVARSTRKSEASMLEDLEWLGLDWDEGPTKVNGPCAPYRQSERSDIYKAAAQTLIDAGYAYPCFCTEEELESKRQLAQKSGKQVAYDGAWRDADPAEVRRRIENGETYTVRFKAPKDHVVSIDDLIRGRVEWDVEATIGDFILLRSSGVPVYNFCVAVDDAFMGVTTVIRAEEHLTNTVRQILVLEALGCREPPQYAHASLILGADRSKLSKRHGATSCGQFRERGYLADALVNYLALLGWNDGTDKEVYSRDELLKAFSIDRVVPSPAMFDEAKLRWLNGQHLRSMPVSNLAALCLDDGFFERAGIIVIETSSSSSSEDDDADADDDDKKTRFFAEAAVAMAQPKAELVTDVARLAADALAYPLRAALGVTADDDSSDDVSSDAAEKPMTPTKSAKNNKPLRDLLDDNFAGFALELCASFENGDAPKWCYDAAEVEAFASDRAAMEKGLNTWLKQLGENTGRKKKRLFLPARLALTGRLAGPDVPAQLVALAAALDAGVQAPGLAPLDCRIAQLKQWALANSAEAPPGPTATTTTTNAGEFPASPSSASDGPAPGARAGAPISFDEFKKLRQVYEAHRRTLDEDPKAMYDVLVAAYDRFRK